MNKIIVSLLFLLLVFTAGCDGDTSQQQTTDNQSIDDLLEQNGLSDVDYLDLSESDTSKSVRGGRTTKKLSLVKLQGKINHFGYDISVTPPVSIDFEATVPDVLVYIDEYPVTRYLNVRSDDDGYWVLWVLKPRGKDLDFSFVYEKEGWITTKSNVITITDENNLDLAIQYIDPLYYEYGVAPMVEEMIGVSLKRVIVTTIAKSWASMYNDELPHGDPEAVALVNGEYYCSSAIGPIYFNESVQPDTSLTTSSADGGVAWINPESGVYRINAYKEGFEYKDAVFNIEDDDEEAGIVLYIATPPDAVMGNNDSAAGEY